MRAPETVNKTPGIGELLWLLRSIIVFIIFAAPAIAYYAAYRQTDRIFLAWYIYGVLFLPIALLAFIMFDSISGLNPFLLIGSIRSTFVPYCAMISVFFVAGFLAINNVPWGDLTLLQIFLIHVAVMYLLIVVGEIRELPVQKKDINPQF